MARRSRAQRARRLPWRLARRARRTALAPLLPSPARAGRSSPTSRSSPRTGTAATRATRARSTRRRASSLPGCAACGSSTRSTRHACRRASTYVIAGTPRVLRPDRPRQVPRQQRQLPQPLRQARGRRSTSRPTTARRSSTWGSTCATRRSPGRRMDFDAASSGGRALGLQRLLERLLDRDLGARVPGALRDARGRLPAQRRARERDRRGRRAHPRGRWGSRPARRAVLYAPTHREYERRLRPELDLARLADALGPGSRHPGPRCTTSTIPTRSCASCTSAGQAARRRGHPSVEELCLAADVLLTDYSSIMFDYAVLDRPIVIHAPDWDEYRARRGTYFDLLAEPPGRGDDAATTNSSRRFARARPGASRPPPARGVPRALLRARRRPRRRARRARGLALGDRAAAERASAMRCRPRR